MKKSRKWSLAGAGVVVLVGGIWGYTALDGAASDLDSSPHRDDRARHDDPVGRGYRQDRADHQGRDQVEGQRHHREADVDVDQRRQAPAKSSSSSTRRSCAPRCARRGPTSRRPAPRYEARRRSSRRTASRRRRPTSSSRSRNYERAQQLTAQKLVSPSGARRRARAPYDLAENRQRSAQVQLGHRRRPRWRRRNGQRRAGPAPPSSAPRRSCATRRSARRSTRTVLTRDVEIGSPVSSILNMGATRRW